MSNEILWFISLIAMLSATLVVFRFGGRTGLISLVASVVILCNLEVMKLTTLFGVTVTLGNILYGVIFFATDLLNEVYGPAEARRAVTTGFVSMVAMTAVMQIALLFSPANDPWAIEVNGAMKLLFGFMPRLAVASIAAYLVSQFHDVWAYNHIRRLSRGRHLWLRNNLSTMVSQLIDTVIFCGIAFWGVLERRVFIDVMVSTYVIKFIVAAFDTPFIYLGRKMAAKGGEQV